MKKTLGPQTTVPQIEWSFDQLLAQLSLTKELASEVKHNSEALSITLFGPKPLSDVEPEENCAHSEGLIKEAINEVVKIKEVLEETLKHQADVRQKVN